MINLIILEKDARPKGQLGSGFFLSASRSAWSSPSGAGFRVGSPPAQPPAPPAFRGPLSPHWAPGRCCPGLFLAPERRPARRQVTCVSDSLSQGGPGARAPLIGGAGPGPAPGRGVRAGGPDGRAQRRISCSEAAQQQKERDAPAADSGAASGGLERARAPPSGSRSYLSRPSGRGSGPRKCGRDRRPGPFAPGRPSGRGRCAAHPGLHSHPRAGCPPPRRPRGCARARGGGWVFGFCLPPPRARPVFPGPPRDRPSFLSPPHSASCPPPLGWGCPPGTGRRGPRAPEGRARRPPPLRGATSRARGCSASPPRARRLRYPATGVRPPVGGRFLDSCFDLTYQWWRLHLW
nr:basic salivary proline-rich protein 2-like [Bubalus bubalis]